MGAEVSQQQREISVVPWVHGFFASQQWNGFEIDSSLERFSGNNSVAELNRYRDEVLFSGGMAEAAGIVQTLSGPLGGFGQISNSVGLVALVISMILENVAKNMGKQTMGTADLLRRVFAEEKANEVRDLMDEYIKQLRINLRDQAGLIESTKRLQSQLSTQLTRLENSMVKDNQITMSARHLNQWMNGAAFHTQMMIHLERLEETDGTKANTVAGIYQQQAGILLDKYKSHLKENLKTEMISYYVPEHYQYPGLSNDFH
ncbi:uncharacterized protein LOC119780158 [Cyprinodon tularosa]|uniref:uncharacterized protein LOC119780158 n=1 Tax=Cyprinodon tularosa TaxID=77115 RepID=UPI0018E24F6B|nr:uncharacterized protein LOC119780158 [Cyprinodon tularosa]